MKEASVKYPINDFAIKRWSPRAFSSQGVEAVKLQSLFEAARWSASAMNEQPWRFILGQKPDDTWTRILDTLVEGNHIWAKEAPVLILVIGGKSFSQDSSANPVFSYDVGQSVANLAIEATNQGLYIHQMGGFSALKATDLFGIPENFQALTVLAAGYLGRADSLPDELKKRELSDRKRFDFNQFVFSSRFGQPADLFNI